jgi:peptidase E
MTPRTILAMGGGGFTMEPENPVLDDFILGLAGRMVPRILFLPTAGGDPSEQITRFRATFGDKHCEPTVLSLFRLADVRRPLRELVLSQDIVYVGGGSMRNLLAIWRVHELDTILREAWHRGVVLAGLSAGGMCWFQGGVTTSSGRPEPTPGYVADDGAALLFRGTRLERAVASRPDARCARVERVGDEVVETPIIPDVLPHAGGAARAAPADIQEFRRARYGSLSR